MFLIPEVKNRINLGNQIAGIHSYQFVILSNDFIGSRWMPNKLAS